MTGNTRTLCLEKKEEGFSFLFYYYLKKNNKGERRMVQAAFLEVNRTYLFLYFAGIS